MFKLITIIFGIILSAQVANAHPGGHGPIDEKHAIEIALDVSEQFVEFDPGLDFGKLHPSWKNIPIENGAINKKGNGYYIVSITNKHQGKILYILLSINGEVYDANFTGVFPGLK